MIPLNNRVWSAMTAGLWMTIDEIALAAACPVPSARSAIHRLRRQGHEIQTQIVKGSICRYRMSPAGYDAAILPGSVGRSS